MPNQLSPEKVQRQTAEAMTVSVHDQMTCVSKPAWDKLFSTLRDSYELVRLTDQSDMPGFSFHSILVQAGERPVLLLPLFQKMYLIEREYAGKGEGLLNTMARLFPRIFHAKIMGVGFEEGEGGQVGFDPEASSETLLAAWSLALDSLERFARSEKADLISFMDFSTESGRILPMARLRDYVSLESYPYGTLSIAFDSLEAYIESLSKTMRKDIRKKLKKAAEIEILHTRNVQPWIEKIYAFYQGVMARTALFYASQTYDYFHTVCDVVPGAEYVLYMLNGELVAFNLLIRNGDCLVDKYFGMNPVIGRQYALYFVSWMENVRYCIEQKITHYEVGPATELEKKRLGATLESNAILIKHRNPLIRPFLKWLSPLFNYMPEVEVPPVQLGTFWNTQSAQ